MDELKRKIADLERQIADIRDGADVRFSEGIRRRTLDDVVRSVVVGSATANENTSTSIGAGGGGVDHPAQYDARVTVEINGTRYYIGLYTV